MSDPAVEAARRRRRRALVYRGVPDGEIAAGCEGATGEEIAAAREALAPVRELHKPTEHSSRWTGVGTQKCQECALPWPCATALTCYTAEELSDGE